MRILSYQDLKDLKGVRFSRQWLRKLILAGKFPRPVHLGAATVGFIESEIDDHLAQCIRERDAEAA